MPFVPKYTTSELKAIIESMKEYPPEQVQRDYLLGKISLKDKMFTLSHYGNAKREIAMREDAGAEGAKSAEIGKSGGGFSGPFMGEAKYYVQNVIKEFKPAWDLVMSNPDQPTGAEAVYHGIMGALNVLKVFDLPGDVVERWALEAAPDSPGIARMANWITWGATNAFGLTAALKAPFMAAGATLRGAAKAGGAVADYASYLKDPVAYVVKQAVVTDAMMAAKLAKATAENTVRKGAGVAGAAVSAEAKGGTQAFQTAAPTTQVASGAAQAIAFTTPQDLEKMTVTELIKHYEQRAVGMIRSSTYDKPIKKGFTRLYRGESKPVVLTEEFKKANQDATAVYGQSRWFTTELESAKFYGNETRKLTYVDVPTSSLESLKASNQAISKNFVRDANTEFFLSPELVQQRKSLFGGVSHAETQAAASAKPISFDEIVARGPDTPISATELEAIGRVHKEVSDAFNSVVDEASKHLGDIRAGNRSDLVQAYKAHLAAMEITNPAFLSGRGQAGRGLEYLKTMQDLVGESKVFDTLTRSLSSEKLLEGSDQAIAYTMNQIYQLGKTERGKLIEEAGKEYSPGTVRLLFKSLLFARPGIHAANIFGNLGSIELHGINKIVSALDPTSAVTMREANAYWSGMWDTRTKWGELWAKAAQTSEQHLSKAGVEGTVTGAMVSKGPLGWLGFEDQFMEGIVSNGLAKGAAVKEGLTKWDELQAAAKAGMFNFPQGTTKKKFLADFIDSSMSDPHNYERLVESIQKETDYIIFHSPLSRGGEMAAKLIRETPLDYLAPVVKFPINAMKMARDWTPGLQMLSKDFIGAVAEGGARADLARSRMALSWMISSQVYEMAKAGYITGDGPVNAQANAAWRAAGNTPRSIHGIPIAWAEPFSTWFSFVADLAHNSNEMTEDNLSNAFQAILTSGYQAVENNYFLRIAQGTVNAVSDVKAVKDLNDILGATVKVIGQPIKTIATGGTVGHVGGEMVNPESPDMKFYGELKDLKNWFFAGTPFGADTRPRLSFTGKPVIMPPMLGTQWIKDNLGAPDSVARGITGLFMPATRQNVGANDPVGQFLDKHELTLHDNWKYYGGTGNLESALPLSSAKPRVNLSGDQAYNWKFIALNDARQYGTNRSWSEAIATLEADPNFQAKNKLEKQQEVNGLYATFRKTGLDILRKIDPEIQQKEAQRDMMEAQQKNQPNLIQKIFGGSSSEAPPDAGVEHPVQFVPQQEAPQ